MSETYIQSQYMINKINIIIIRQGVSVGASVRSGVGPDASSGCATLVGVSVGHSLDTSIDE
jgi:hypothetical protein